MQVCEIFYSIQGESSFSGLPCIFIRLTGCNLRCIYCDTPYSYDQGTDYTIDAILKEISVYKCKLVLITGGEPLYQAQTHELIESLHAAGYEILLETNGSYSIEQVQPYVHTIIDVKLPGSGESNSFFLPNIMYLKKDMDEIKFVISDRFDFDTAIQFINQHNLHNHSLLFSPMTDKLAPAVLVEWIKDTSLRVRLNLQIHKIIWDKDTRAV